MGRVSLLKIAQLQQQYGLKEIIFVGDRGMITHAVAQKIQGVEGLYTISALTHRQIVELLERKVVSPELFDERQIVEVLDPQDPKRRYCLCRNPQTAGQEAATRASLLKRAGAQLDKIANSRRRSAVQRLGARVGRVLERSKMSKFIRSSSGKSLMDDFPGTLIRTRSLPKLSLTVVTL